MMRTLAKTLFVAVAGALVTGAWANIDVQSDGSDGNLTLSGGRWATYTFDLAQAVTAPWNTPSPTPGKGVYDPLLWAVVYKFNSFNVTDDISIAFASHPSGCPVVILIKGNANINGGWNLNGSSGSGATQSIPGPGGFRGGAGFYTVDGSGGFGPGGGSYQTGIIGGGAGHSAAGTRNPFGLPYGNETCIPLVGGSGGAGVGAPPGNYGVAGGGAGGGALLIACEGTLTCNGSFGLVGGNGSQFTYYDATAGGSGGAIRLISDTINFGGTINALGSNYSSAGRVRIEANTRNITGTILPLPSVTSAAQTPQLWPDSTTPQLQITSVGGQTAPADPRSNLYAPDVELSSNGSKVVRVAAMNVPTDGSWTVQVKMTPKNGADTTTNCTFVSGNQALSVWECTINVGSGNAALIARAQKN
ncbi:MAG: hypothetical protein JST40_06815 [Armatimonadetes bacterium]|nr:hypothetical protein [Armatimonadota bacterium]